MDCPQCGFANSPDARFCQNCGRPLLLICANCQTANPAPANFCKNCGHPLGSPSEAAAAATEPAADPLQQLMPGELAAKLEMARARRTMVGERRIVTMLFCDVKGSTAAAERFDPEEWAEIINGAFAPMIGPIYRYEGTVARLMGDGLLAFFGAPIAHEDDPERAVLAGLEIAEGVARYARDVRQRWGIEIAVRVGINTGLVVVGAVGTDLRMEYSALGDAINVAAKMEQTAEPGTVRVAEDTYEQTAALFDYEALGPMTIAGRSEPVSVYRALRPHARGRRSPAGFETPLIARDREIGELKRVLSNLHFGVGRIVALVGDAGLGKSRLAEELRAECAQTDEGRRIRWVDNRSASYESARPYGVFRQFVRELGGLGDDSPAEAASARLAPLLADHGGEYPERALGALLLLLGLAPDRPDQGLEGEAFRQELYEALEHLLTRWATRPTILLFDDLHWADHSSTELLVHLFRLVESTPVVFLCLFRPDRLAPSWRIKTAGETDYAHRYTEISLRPLSEADSVQLVDKLLAMSELPSRLREQIIARAEGNPFYIEEVSRSLKEAGKGEGGPASPGALGPAADLRLPGSVQALLTARIDRLEDEARQTLQLASVIGRRFYYRVLQRVSAISDELDAQLGALQRLDLVREAARFPEMEYLFRHALIQEAAYQTILLRQRREYHHRVAESIVELYPDRLDEFATQLAFHFDQAGDGRALTFYRRAADAAFRLFANNEAIPLYERALEMALKLPGADRELLVHLYTRRGRALELSDRFVDARQSYEEMERLGRERKDRPLELVALTLQVKIRSNVNTEWEPAEARRLAEKALALAESLGDEQAMASILWSLSSLARFVALPIEEGIAYGERALGLARKLGLNEELPFILNDLSDVYATSGRLERALVLSAEAQQLWRNQENLPMLADSIATGAMFLSIQGEFDQALVNYEEALRLSRQTGNLWGQGYSLAWSGFPLWYLGDIEGALNALHQGIELSTRAGFLVGQVFPRTYLMWIYQMVGDPVAALASVEAAAEVAERHLPFMRPSSEAARAEVLATTGRVAEALAIVDALDLPLTSQELVLTIGQFYSTIQVYLKAGAYAAALPVIETHLRLLEGMEIPTTRVTDLLMLGRAHYGRGDRESARSALLTARDSAVAINQRVDLWPILALLGDVERDLGRPAEAEALHREAGDIVRTIAERTPTADPVTGRDLRASFLARPEVARLL